MGAVKHEVRHAHEFVEVPEVEIREEFEAFCESTVVVAYYYHAYHHKDISGTAKPWEGVLTQLQNGSESSPLRISGLNKGRPNRFINNNNTNNPEWKKKKESCSG